MRRSCRCLLFAAVLCGGAAAAPAQNLLQNGTFDTTVDPWTSPNSVAELSSLDAAGAATSGSLRGINASPDPSSVSLISECIPVVGGTLYERRYDYLIEPASGRNPLVFVQVNWYDDPTCFSSLFGEGGSGGDIADGGWHASPDPVEQLAAPSQALGARLLLVISKPEAGGSVKANFDNVVFKVAGTCTPLPNVLCLNQDRFQIEANWRTAADSGRAQVVKLTNDTGYLWFFNPDNVEVVVKILNACSSFGKFWVFAGGLTNVEVDIFVTDTKSGVIKVYHNQIGEPFAPLQDTSGFSTCP
jgi:hypothetical protein